MVKKISKCSYEGEVRNLGRQEHLVVYQYVGAYLTKRFQQADCVMINGEQNMGSE